MEWIAPIFTGILVGSVLLQLFWAWATSTIARKTGQSGLMQVLAWIPLLQIAPVLAAGDGSLVRMLLAGVALALANGVLFGAAAFLGEGLGGVLATAGLGATLLISLVYFGVIAWRTAVNRDLPGWVGLMTFVPFFGVFAYPFIAFHDGWERPNLVGLAIAVVLGLGSILPSLQALELLQQQGGLAGELEAWQAEAMIDPGQLDAMPQGIVSSTPSTAGAAPAPLPTERAVEHGDSIRALFALRQSFDRLDDIVEREDLELADRRALVLDLLRSIRADLEARRGTIDRETYEQLATHLLEVEARIHAAAAGGLAAPVTKITANDEPRSIWDSRDSPGPAAPAPFTDEERPAPIRPFPVEAGDGCPDGTELRSQTREGGEEEWCQQLDQLGGLRHGWYARYRADGRPESMGEYRDGLRVGVWTRFYETGEVRAQAEFRAGLQHGWLLSFDRSGERTRAVRFVEGSAVR